MTIIKKMKPRNIAPRRWPNQNISKIKVKLHLIYILQNNDFLVHISYLLVGVMHYGPHVDPVIWALGGHFTVGPGTNMKYGALPGTSRGPEPWGRCVMQAICSVLDWEQFQSHLVQMWNTNDWLCIFSFIFFTHSTRFRHQQKKMLHTWKLIEIKQFHFQLAKQRLKLASFY